MAELAGLPVVVGLYATMLPLVGYALFGSSRQLVVGPEGTLAALTAVTIAPLAGGDPAQYAALAAALALVMGVVLLLGGLLHLGFMADFFSKPVLLGYINGTALTIIASQLGKLLGVSISEQDFFPMLREVLSELGDVDPLTAVLSISLFGLALLLRRVVPKVPATLVVVVVAIVTSVAFDLEDEGVAVVGDVEAGLPPIGAPGRRPGRDRRPPPARVRVRSDRVRGHDRAVRVRMPSRTATRSTPTASWQDSAAQISHRGSRLRFRSRALARAPR